MIKNKKSVAWKLIIQKRNKPGNLWFQPLFTFATETLSRRMFSTYIIFSKPWGNEKILNEIFLGTNLII
jgi:hypothetical protein